MAISLAVLGGCTGDDAVETTDAQIPGTSAPEPVTTSTQQLVTGCPSEGDFVEGGRIGRVENPESDTGTIGLIGWESEESCETFEISFETLEGAPATTPPTITADYIDDVGVIRVRLNAASTVVTDQLVETDLVERLYVVNALDGGMFIDFLLAAPAQARIATQSSPARMTLQMQPGIVDYAGGITSSGPVVLISPREDSTVPASTSVEGYARTLVPEVLVIATQGDEVVAESNATTADSLETWGEFRAEIGLVPGRVSLFVGSEDPESGRFEGVSIDLTVQ